MHSYLLVTVHVYLYTNARRYWMHLLINECTNKWTYKWTYLQTNAHLSRIDIHVLRRGKFSTNLSPSGRIRQVQNTTRYHNSGRMNLNSIRISTVRGHAPYKYPARNTKPKSPGTNSNPLRIFWSDASFSPTVASSYKCFYKYMYVPINIWMHLQMTECTNECIHKQIHLSRIDVHVLSRVVTNWSKESPPPRGVCYLLCSLIKNCE